MTLLNDTYIFEASFNKQYCLKFNKKKSCLIFICLTYLDHSFRAIIVFPNLEKLLN